MANHLALV